MMNFKWEVSKMYKQELWIQRFLGAINESLCNTVTLSNGDSGGSEAMLFVTVIFLLCFQQGRLPRHTSSAAVVVLSCSFGRTRPCLEDDSRNSRSRRERQKWLQ
jgi:hypothetical protein